MNTQMSKYPYVCTHNHMHTYTHTSTNNYTCMHRHIRLHKHTGHTHKHTGITWHRALWDLIQIQESVKPINSKPAAAAAIVSPGRKNILSRKQKRYTSLHI